jgi:hypothetical protein
VGGLEQPAQQKGNRSLTSLFGASLPFALTSCSGHGGGEDVKQNPVAASLPITMQWVASSRTAMVCAATTTLTTREGAPPLNWETITYDPMNAFPGGPT